MSSIHFPRDIRVSKLLDVYIYSLHFLGILNMNDTLISEILSYSFDLACSYLNNWAIYLESRELLAQVFGDNFNRDLANTLLQNWQEKNFVDLPEIKIVSKSEINNANGAYASENKTIYLAEEFLL